VDRSLGRARGKGVLVLLSILRLLYSITAQASPTSSEPRPPWVWPLGLSVQDESLVLGLSATSPESNKRRARQIILELAGKAAWKARAVVDDLRKREIDLSENGGSNSVEVAQTRLNAISSKFSTGACAKFRERADRFLSALDTVGTPTPIEADEIGKACGLPKLDLGSVRVVTIPTRDSDEVTTVVLTPLYRVATPASVRVGHRSLLFLAVAPASRVLVITEDAQGSSGKSIRVPAAEALLADADVAARSWQPACVDLFGLKTSAGAQISVDGFPVDKSRPVELIQSAMTSVLQVFNPMGHRILRRDIPSSQVGGLNCTSIDQDATESSKKTVLVFVSTSGTSCSDLAVDPVKIRAQVDQMMKGQFDTRGIEVVEVLKTVANVRTTLMSFGSGSATNSGQVEGLSGSADVARALQDVGFSEALTLDVRCERRADNEVRYAVAGRRIDLDGLVDAADRDERETRMQALGGVLTSQIETQSGEQSLRGLLQATVGRLFQIPYVRFANGGTERAARGDIHFELEASFWGERAKTRMFARPINESERLLCADLDDLNSVRSSPGLNEPAFAEPAFRKDDGSWTDSKTSDLKPLADASETGRSTDEEKGGSSDKPSLRPSPSAPGSGLGATSVEIPFYPVEPGEYRIYVEVSGDGPIRPGEQTHAPVSTSRCIEVAEPSYSLAFELDHLGGVSWGRMWQGESMSTTYALGGVARHTNEAYSFGMLAGLGYTVYGANGPPSWANISQTTPGGGLGASGATGVTFAPDGTLSLGWTRISMAVALSFEIRIWRLADVVPSCWRYEVQSSKFRSSGIYLGLTPLIDLGWYFTGSIPQGLQDFRGNADHPFDVDGSALFSVFYKLNLPEGQVLKLGIQAAWLGFDDWGRGDSRRAAHITYDNWLAWGPQIGFGWSP
jgi:hypothetical protein